jgi:hypothetical protein
MTASVRRILCGLGLALAVVSTGCDNYTYITVHASLDGSTQKTSYDLIAACSVSVLTGGDENAVIEYGRTLQVWADDRYVAACQESHTIPGEFGTFNYSTARSSGTLKFALSMFTKEEMNNPTNPTPFIQGASKDVPLSPGAEIGNSTSDRIDVIAKSCMPSGCVDPHASGCGPSCSLKIVRPW